MPVSSFYCENLILVPDIEVGIHKNYITFTQINNYIKKNRFFSPNMYMVHVVLGKRLEDTSSY